MKILKFLKFKGINNRICPQNIFSMRGYRAMVNHEARKSRMRKKDRIHSWFMTSVIVPPDDIPTDDEGVNDVAARPFRGRKVIRRKVDPSSQEYENFLSKFICPLFLLYMN